MFGRSATSSLSISVVAALLVVLPAAILPSSAAAAEPRSQRQAERIGSLVAAGVPREQATKIVLNTPPQPTLADAVRAGQGNKKAVASPDERVATAPSIDEWVKNPENFKPPVLHQAPRMNPERAFWVWWLSLPSYAHLALWTFVAALACMAAIVVWVSRRPNRWQWLVGQWSRWGRRTPATLAFVAGGALVLSALTTSEEPWLTLTAGSVFLVLGLGLLAIGQFTARAR